jgi:hypothetical protein
MVISFDTRIDTQMGLVQILVLPSCPTLVKTKSFCWRFTLDTTTSLLGARRSQNKHPSTSPRANFPKQKSIARDSQSPYLWSLVKTAAAAAAVVCFSLLGLTTNESNECCRNSTPQQQSSAIALVSSLEQITLFYGFSLCFCNLFLMVREDCCTHERLGVLENLGWCVFAVLLFFFLVLSFFWFSSSSSFSSLGVPSIC